MNLLSDRSWAVLKKYLDEIVENETRILSSSDKLEEILRAQGAKRVHNKLEDRIRSIVNDAREEEKENG